MTEDEALDLCRVIAGEGLVRTREVTPTTVEDELWTRVLARVRGERISGLAVECEAAGWLRLSERQLDDLLELHRDAMAWSLTVERKLTALADAFDDEGIAFAVLKGPSVAHTAYLDPSMRSFGDLDVLVRTTDYERACGLLARLGHVRRRPEPRPGFEARFGKASVHQHPRDGIEVDLHRTLVLGPFGLWIRPEELMERRATFDLGGRSIPRLDDTGMLLNVAMHASLGWRPPRLVPLRDVAQVSSSGDVEWDALTGWAREWRLTAVLQHAFGISSETVGFAPPEGAAPFIEASPPRRERRALVAYTSARREEGGTAIGSLRAIPGLLSKAAYVRALAFPDRTFLIQRTGSGRQPSYVRRWSVPARWLGRRLSGWRVQDTNTET